MTGDPNHEAQETYEVVITAVTRAGDVDEETANQTVTITVDNVNEAATGEITVVPHPGGFPNTVQFSSTLSDPDVPAAVLAYSYYALGDEANPVTVSSPLLVAIGVDNPGFYVAQVTVTDTVFGNEATTLTSDVFAVGVAVNVLAFNGGGNDPDVNDVGDTLVANIGTPAGIDDLVISYQWFRDGTAIQDATNINYITDGAGDYTVQVTYADGDGAEIATFTSAATAVTAPTTSPGATGQTFVLTAGNDTFEGTSGDDVFSIFASDGGATGGVDELTGLGGNGIFAFDPSNRATITITDFTFGDDKIRIDAPDNVTITKGSELIDNTDVASIITTTSNGSLIIRLNGASRSRINIEGDLVDQIETTFNGIGETVYLTDEFFEDTDNFAAVFDIV